MDFMERAREKGRMQYEADKKAKLIERQKKLKSYNNVIKQRESTAQKAAKKININKTVQDIFVRKSKGYNLLRKHSMFLG